MDSIIYFLATHYPWWGFPLAASLADIGNTQRRRGAKLRAAFLFFLSLLFLSLGVAYFVFNGFEKLRPAMQNIEKNYLN